MKNLISLLVAAVVVAMSAVLEPANVAMLLAGVCMIGVSIRMRRR